MKKKIKKMRFSGLRAFLTQGWTVRWWKKKKNGEWKKQNEKVIFDDRHKIVKFAGKKMKKGFIVEIAPFSSPSSAAYSGPIY
ncbi:hypothetical protein HZB06_01750 [Candidatus Wolfebacteria bacterium]|nr:hypothetical protein [Candidatus Wolfebacteria bacterium]